MVVLKEKLVSQKNITVDFNEIKSANHFFTGKEKDLVDYNFWLCQKESELFLISPPLIGFAIPVVSGNVIGNIFADLAAKYAKA